MISNYTIKKLIGTGSFGEIYLAFDKINNCNVAIKKIYIKDFRRSTIDMITTEIKIGYFNNCPYIVKIKDFFLDISKKTIYIIMENYEQSDLGKFKKKYHLSKEEKKNIIFNILHGVQYLHINKVIHRDLKLENILISNKNANIGDFGTCRILPENKYFTSTCIGTPYYLSPEIISGNTYNTKVDIYSLGCILCELFYNKLPYNAGNINALYYNIINSKKNIHIDKTTKIGNLINSMIDKDSYNRPLIEDVVSELEEYYNVNNNNFYRKDDDFYYQIRKNYCTPKNIFELDKIIKEIKSSKINYNYS